MNKDKRLGKLITDIGNIDCNIHEDEYSFMVEQIVGQMLSNKAAASIIGRLWNLCDGKLTPNSVASLSIEELRSIGISSAKSQYIINFTELVNDEQIDFDELSDLPDHEVIKRLTGIRGIGNWTAKMFLLFVLRRPDVLPFEDIAFLQSYKWLYKTEDIKKESVIKKCEKWKPYSSIAARYLYRALDCGMTKEPFHLNKSKITDI